MTLRGRGPGPWAGQHVLAPRSSDTGETVTQAEDLHALDTFISSSFIDFIKLKRKDEKTFACLDVKIQYVSRLLSVRSGQVCVLFVKSHVIVRGSIRL